VDTSHFTIKESLTVSVWGLETGQSSQTYDEIRENLVLLFKKVAPTEANLHKLELVLLDVKQSGRPLKYTDVSTHLEETVLQLPRKSTVM
jgi:hypothetical protein